MKKIMAAFIGLSLLASCGGSSKETPKSIAQTWCDLNGKVYRAAEGEEKEKAKKDRKDYEQKMQEKYGKDENFMKEIGVEVEKCEAASEGK